MAEGAGRFLAAVGVVVVAVIVGSAFWLQFSTFPHTGDRPTTPASAPAGEADRLATSPQPPSSTILGSDPPASATQPVETTQDSTTVMPRISFDFGSEGINAESRRALDTIVVAMNANPDWRVAIEGHTDAQGTPDYNRALSERRAQAVRAYLQLAGIARERLSVAGFGASRPVARNDAAGKVLNRRVELHRQ
jgi:outer membrane protein OmpA-like peptidoglycan-associated protein